MLLSVVNEKLSRLQFCALQGALVTRASLSAQRHVPRFGWRGDDKRCALKGVGALPSGMATRRASGICRCC